MEQWSAVLNLKKQESVVNCFIQKKGVSCNTGQMTKKQRNKYIQNLLKSLADVCW